VSTIMCMHAVVYAEAMHAYVSFDHKHVLQAVI